VIPFTTFDAHLKSFFARFEKLKAQVPNIGISAAGGGR
jgi:hypothetical protein